MTILHQYRKIERAWFEVIAESLRNPKLRQTVQQRAELEEIVTEFLKQMKKEGDFFRDNVDLKTIARGIIASYHGLTIMRITNRNDDTIRDSWIKTMLCIFTGAGK